MRIAFFADNFYPEISGIFDSIAMTGGELVLRGHSVMYVAPYYAPRDYKIALRTPPIKNKPEEVNGMPVVRLPSLPLPFSPTRQSRLALPIGSSLTSLKKFKPDIIHTNSPYGTGLEALRAARYLHVPMVGTNHTMVEEFYPAIPNIARKLDAAYYNHCAYITAPYAALIANMRAKGFRQPAQVLANPVNVSLFQPPTAVEKITLKQKMNCMGPVILDCGRLGIEKHVDVIIHAIARMVPQFPNILFIATGHGVEEVRLKQLTKKLEIEKNVRFTGFVETHLLTDYYKVADVFAIMSTSDSQSIALMQAFASGVPAVGARSHGLPDYLRPDCGFLVEPGDDQALALKITQLLLDTSLSKQMGEAAVSFVQSMSPPKIAEEWEKIYTRVIPTH